MYLCKEVYKQSTATLIGTPVNFLFNARYYFHSDWEDELFLLQLKTNVRQMCNCCDGKATQCG